MKWLSRCHVVSMSFVIHYRVGCKSVLLSLSLFHSFGLLYKIKSSFSWHFVFLSKWNVILSTWFVQFSHDASTHTPSKVNANWRETLWCLVVKEEYIHELNGCLLFHFGLLSFFSHVCLCVPSSCFCILNKSISMLFENNAEFKFQPLIFRWIFVKNVIETPRFIKYILRVQRTLKLKKLKLTFHINKLIHNSNETHLFALCNFLKVILSCSCLVFISGKCVKSNYFNSDFDRCNLENVFELVKMNDI